MAAPQPSGKKLSWREARAQRDCGVCTDDMAMFDEMRQQINAQAAAIKTPAQGFATSSANPHSAAAAASAPSSTAAPSSSSSAAATPLPCPPDSASLGRATWTFLHTMSAYYPDAPTPAQQSRMRSLLLNFASFYPCPPCAEHFAAHLETHAPPTDSRSRLSRFLCNYHNDVNARLSKPKFDCDRYDERWRDGPPEDAKYDCVEEE